MKANLDSPEVFNNITNGEVVTAPEPVKSELVHLYFGKFGINVLVNFA